jgi:hypothetical protein
MAATGYTPLSLYYTTTAAGVPLAANLVSGELAINITDGKLYYKNASNVVTLLASTAGAAGDVVGPASATDNALVRFDATTGKLVQNSVGILSDAGVLTGLTGLTSSGSVTFSGLTSGRVTYATAGGQLIDSANLTFDGSQLTINGITAGRGAGSVATNTAFGAAALAANTTAEYSTAVGYNALDSVTIGNDNTALGYSAGSAITSGTGNTAVGSIALDAVLTGNSNTAVGQGAATNATGDSNTAIGTSAFGGTSGQINTCIGYFSGQAMTTGSYNTIVGSFNGNSNGLDIRASSNYVVLSDGFGSPIATYNATGVGFYVQGSITSKSSGTTLTGAEVLTQILNTTVGGITVTMPTGTTLDTATGGMPTNTAFMFTVINTAGSSSTVAVNTGITSIGSLTVAANASATYKIRKTAANTFIMYRT